MAFIDDVAEWSGMDIALDGVQKYIDAAEAYLTDADIAVAETDELYCLAVKMLVSMWKDDRCPIGTISGNPFGVIGIIQKLQFRGAAT